MLRILITLRRLFASISCWLGNNKFWLCIYVVIGKHLWSEISITICSVFSIWSTSRLLYFYFHELLLIWTASLYRTFAYLVLILSLLKLLLLIDCKVLRFFYKTAILTVTFSIRRVGIARTFLSLLLGYLLILKLLLYKKMLLWIFLKRSILVWEILVGLCIIACKLSIRINL